MDPNAIIAETRRWLTSFVVGLDLCPFAGEVLARDDVRFRVSGARTAAQLLEDLAEEMARLDADPGIETTLLIHPGVLTDFLDFNDFLDEVDGLLDVSDRLGVYQVASFHPRYRFAGAPADDVAHCTNRSPWPMLHLLREQSLEGAIRGHPDPDGIPDRNIDLLRALGSARVAELLDPAGGAP